MVHSSESADKRLTKQLHASECTVMLNVSLGSSMQVHIAMFYNKELHGNIGLGTCCVFIIVVSIS